MAYFKYLLTLLADKNNMHKKFKCGLSYIFFLKL